MLDRERLFAAPLPSLETGRLLLRAMVPADSPAIQRHLGDKRVAETTLMVPHPYPAGAADEFIARLPGSWLEGKMATWGLVPRAGGDLFGAISLRLSGAHHRGEVGYWVAVSEWGKGFATEATRRVISFAFDELGLHRVEAHHFTVNPASGRVLAKAGMRAEGEMRGAVFRDGTPRDLALYAILRTDPRG
jgi:ribosomal-protein-alanine N-acetyltransferase